MIEQQNPENTGLPTYLNFPKQFTQTLQPKMERDFLVQPTQTRTNFKILPDRKCSEMCFTLKHNLLRARTNKLLSRRNIKHHGKDKRSSPFDTEKPPPKNNSTHPFAPELPGPEKVITTSPNHPIGY